jgi:hypothetical protein
MARVKSRLARARPTRSPRRRFIIYCEGKKTEPGYFHALEGFLKSAIIDVEVEPTGVPKTIAEAAVARARREGLAKGSRRKPENSFELKNLSKFVAALASMSVDQIRVSRSG